jgi:hypothetical protein
VVRVEPRSLVVAVALEAYAGDGCTWSRQLMGSPARLATWMETTVPPFTRSWPPIGGRKVIIL